jgi:hypothetical protein
VKLSLHALVTIGAAAILMSLVPARADANDRQQCLNDCTQAGTTQTQKCHADHDQQMIACGKLGTNQERNTCKKQAAQDLRTCAETARQKVKQCQQACPAK